MKQRLEKIKEITIKNWKWIVLFFCIVCFLLLAEDVYDKEIMSRDIMGYNLVSTYLISDFATPIAKLITNCGGAITLITISIILLIVIKNKKIGISIISNLGIVTVLNIALKRILQRPRPSEFSIINESGYSFPSGHSMISMAFCGLLIYLIYKNIKNKYLKWTLITFLGILIFSIGISRIYLGVHYTSDVLAGFLIAISYLIVYISIMNKFIVERD